MGGDPTLGSGKDQNLDLDRWADCSIKLSIYSVPKFKPTLSLIPNKPAPSFLSSFLGGNLYHRTPRGRASSASTLSKLTERISTMRWERLIVIFLQIFFYRIASVWCRCYPDVVRYKATDRWRYLPYCTVLHRIALKLIYPIVSDEMRSTVIFNPFIQYCYTTPRTAR